jgi:uncharacterized membrane protein
LLAKIRNNFIVGLLVLLPAVVTILLLRWFIATVNSLLLEPIASILRPYLPEAYLKNVAKGVMLIIVILLIVVIGFISKSLLGRRLINYIERAFLKVPMINTIYGATKDVISAFSGTGKTTMFSKVVMVEYPRKGMYSIGFITSEGMGEVQEKTKENVMNVFIPTTPNPTTGMFVMVPKEDLTILDMKIEDGLKLILSGGAVTPQYKGVETLPNRG